MNGKLDTPLRGAIASMTRENVIGLDGKMPWHYPEDLKRFKRKTLNSTVIMGRLTWESINCRALPGRRNIVISRNPVDGVEHFHKIDQAMESCNEEDIWIIGGGQIYSAIFSRLTLLDITYVPDVINSPNAIKFPRIDPADWQAEKITTLSDSPLVNVIYHKK